MKSFLERAVETRFFDHDGNATDADKAVITIIRTDDNHVGKGWHNVNLVAGHRAGDKEDTPELAVLWGMTKTISNSAKQRDIKIERGEMSLHGPRYKQNVIIDGEHRAIFIPNSFGNDYSLRDLEKQQVKVHPEARGYGSNATADTIADMEQVTRKWYEQIPTDEDMAKRTQAKADQEERQRLEREERERQEQIRGAAPELLEALEGLMSEAKYGPAVNPNANWSQKVINDPVQQKWIKARAAIDKATK